ncbi:Ldh family oxidoreductase [Candidatus Poribacteria bacterium]|jgi:hydroxycarboxylate dehydrogenase B|nr:Ldh family oxidoreductase [Candidatus Poribacteria bacterium]MBT5533580.1 Ldh family oxidoreductase [Candidatus Poribacteria bacterium]MBT5712108.1 Ldh family oxidoreductase [Candidatus Poribacteria bacterium]MBT7803869.1 Ldh family oxidoreductase [Candidatus Poribacteria bacterium]
MPDAYHRVDADALRTFAEELFLAAGTPPDIAECVAGIVINADLAGHPSHGVFRIIGYMPAIERGHMVPDARPEILDEKTGAASVDAKRGWGHYAAQWSMRLAIEKAKETGIACVSLRNYAHIGRLGQYVEQAAEAGCVGIITLGEGGRGVGPAAPFGGTEPALLTNPFTIGAPTGDDTPFVSDFATTVVANGKIRVAREENRELPAGAIVDKHHQPSVDPDDWFDGGQSVIFGGHKGYALSLATCLLGGLTGNFGTEWNRMHGVFLVAIDVAAFLPPDEYSRNARAFLDGITDNPPAEGFDEVVAPGEPEQRSRREKLEVGIDVPDAVWRQLGEAAAKLGVTPPG